MSKTREIHPLNHAFLFPSNEAHGGTSQPPVPLLSMSLHDKRAVSTSITQTYFS